MKTENRVTAQPDFPGETFGVPGISRGNTSAAPRCHGETRGAGFPDFGGNRTYLTFFLQKYFVKNNFLQKIFFLQKSSFFKNSVRNTCGALVFLSKRTCF